MYVPPCYVMSLEKDITTLIIQLNIDIVVKLFNHAGIQFCDTLMEHIYHELQGPPVLK